MKITEANALRLEQIKKLALEYYGYEPGQLIELHTQGLRFFTIRNSKHLDHPHVGVRVYISRRSLKHFVESRKAELSRNHTSEDTLNIIAFALEQVRSTVTDYTVYEHGPPVNHVYTKDFSHQGKPLLRVLMELRRGRFEIKSIHFKKLSRKKRK